MIRSKLIKCFSCVLKLPDRADCRRVMAEGRFRQSGATVKWHIRLLTAGKLCCTRDFYPARQQAFQTQRGLYWMLLMTLSKSKAERSVSFAL